jgi:membrane-bound metal-dependent hydrolase YbcI (DUF457 family)
MHPDPHWPFLSDPSHPVLSVVWSVLIHGVIAVLVIAPILLRSGHRALWSALAFAGGSAVDFDHVLASGSLDPDRLEHIAGGRPATHSLLFAIALATLVLGLTRRVPSAWAVFAVVVSHLLFDAAGGSERWLYPFEQPQSIPWLLCPIGLLLLLAISDLIAHRFMSPSPSPEPEGNRADPPLATRAAAGLRSESVRLALIALSAAVVLAGIVVDLDAPAGAATLPGRDHVQARALGWRGQR